MTMEFPQEIDHFPIEALNSGSCGHLQTHLAYRLQERRAMLVYVTNTTCKNPLCPTCRLSEAHAQSEIELFEKLLLDATTKLGELKAEELKSGKPAKAQQVHEEDSDDEEQ